MDTRGGTIGGGEVLQYIGNNRGRTIWYVDYGLEQQFIYITYMKIAITILILFVALVMILRMFNIRYMLRGKGMSLEIQNVRSIRNRDKHIMQMTRAMRRLVDFWEKTPLRVQKVQGEYLNYNLARAGWTGPNGRILQAVEYNALIQTVRAFAVGVGVMVGILHSVVAGVIVAGLGTGLVGAVTNRVLRSSVLIKDREIQKNFYDMYMMLHYTLISGAMTPIDRVLRSYSRSTDSQEMKRFVTNCCSRIDTYGEYGATQYIISDYREIPEVVKLMRLIKQLREGGDVEEELIGFRKEIVTARRIALEKHGDLMIAKANASMIIIRLILIQAALSAMAIYIPDLLGGAQMFGVG